MVEHPAASRQKTDEELIAEFQSGRAEAFNVLVGRYKDPLMNFACRFLGDEDDADDVVQEVFIRVYRNKHAFRPIAKFSTWIYTITANLAKTQLRRRKRHALFSLSRRTQGRDDEREIPDVRYPADQLAESTLRREIIQQSLLSVKEKYREIVVLRDVQELSYEEICEVTGLTMGTVKSRINRGRAQLQVLLKELLDERE